MNMAKGVVKSEIGKQNVEFSTFNIKRGTVLYRIDILYYWKKYMCYTTIVLGAPDHVFSFNL